MHIGQVAAQLYTVRDHLANARQVAASLGKVRAMGYRAVEVAGLGDVTADQLSRMLHDQGLTCCAVHVPAEQLLTDPAAVAEGLIKLHCDIAVYPWPGDLQFDSLYTVRRLAQQLNAAGLALANAGITLCYHNHHMELHRVDGRTALEILFEDTDPAAMKAELDTYWIQHGGGDPVDWCRRLKGRLACLHMKDVAVTADRQVVFAEVGSGNLNWPAIIAAAEDAGCRWFIPEQDTCDGDPFDALKKSLSYIHQNFCS